ncbi:PTS sugar transporter subunit IIA [Thermoflavimicrobium dichotomicum]|uniref:PTS system, fructose-specific IIA component n=1 Tax=Thermoflavimicrobium dichotomicum TaxID=46223 RepID=A0A1I3RLD3_9BACL|nr:PTS sugar transporter subunit IIA [Thermoflavimicrobium dichotomicum]SFJ46672.1 PTS system, fructose-specific IIA component [Thermoflavimicrobium dichotomicum]
MIQDYISEELIQLDIQAEMREEIIDRLAELMEKKEVMAECEDFLSHVFERERNGTTAIGSEIAIPHGASKEVQTPAIAFARLTRPIYWDNGQPVSHVFLVAAPEGKERDLYASLKERLQDQQAQELLKSAKTPQEIVSALQA